MKLLSDILYWSHYVWLCALAWVLRAANKALDLIEGK